MKYLLVFLSALILEICSTYYIRFVSEKNLYGSLFFASISPFLSLVFTGYMVETKVWRERIYLAFAMSLGYSLGVLMVLQNT